MRKVYFSLRNKMYTDIPEKLIKMIKTTSRKVREELADSITRSEVSTFMKKYSKSSIDELLRTLISRTSSQNPLGIFRTNAEFTWKAPQKAVLNRCNSFYIYVPSSGVFISMCDASPPVSIQYLI
jgi:hypothetical protein